MDPRNYQPGTRQKGARRLLWKGSRKAHADQIKERVTRRVHLAGEEKRSRTGGSPRSTQVEHGNSPIE